MALSERTQRLLDLRERSGQRQAPLPRPSGPDPIDSLRSRVSTQQRGQFQAPYLDLKRQALEARNKAYENFIRARQNQLHALTARPTGGLSPAGGLDASGHKYGAASQQYGPLMNLGQGSHRLRQQAAGAFKYAEQLAGRQIRLTDSYRSTAVQADLKRRKPNLAAAPGTSLHEVGLAIDVTNHSDPGVREALNQAGFRQFSVSKEPWHFSFGITG